MLNYLLLSCLAMVEVEHEKGTHPHACRMLHLDNYSLKLMGVQLDRFTSLIWLRNNITKGYNLNTTLITSLMRGVGHY